MNVIRTVVSHRLPAPPETEVLPKMHVYFKIKIRIGKIITKYLRKNLQTRPHKTRKFK